MAQTHDAPALSAGNHLYLYKLLVEQVGCGRQTFVTRIEEALATDRMTADDLGFASTRELLEELDDFVELRVFKGGRIYATIVAQPAWDAALAEQLQEKAGGKPARRRGRGKVPKPVKPRRVRREPAAEPAAAGGAKAAAEPVAKDPAAESEAEDRAEQPAADLGGPEPAPASPTEPGQEQRPASQAVPAQTTPPGTQTEAEPVPGPDAAPEAEAEAVLAVAPEIELAAEPAADLELEAGPGPDPEAGPEPETGPGTKSEPEPEPTTLAVSLTIVYDPDEEPEAAPNQPNHAADATAAAPTTPAAPAAPDTPPSPRALRDYPQDFATEVYLPPALETQLLAALPFGAQAASSLADAFEQARGTEALLGNRAQARFEVPLPESALTCTATIGRRNMGACAWALSALEFKTRS